MISWALGAQHMLGVISPNLRHHFPLQKYREVGLTPQGGSARMRTWRPHAEHARADPEPCREDLAMFTRKISAKRKADAESVTRSVIFPSSLREISEGVGPWR